MWEDEETPASTYYRPLGIPLPRLERLALDHCRGPVLDVGAGAGRLSLELQDRGVAVTAVDIAPVAVEIMRERGVVDARCEDLYEHRGGPYATLLLAMHGIGVVGSYEGLEAFFDGAHRLLRPGGQILCDSADLDLATEDDDLSLSLADETGHQPGQVFFQTAFGDELGEAYPWLFIGEDDLGAHAAVAGFQLTVLARADRGRFLARLTRVIEVDDRGR